MQDTFKTMLTRQDTYSVNSMGVGTTESQERIDAYRAELEPVDTSRMTPTICNIINTALIKGV